MVLDWSQHDEVKFVYTAILVVFAQILQILSCISCFPVVGCE